MRLLYWGTPAYAVPTLSALHAAGHAIVGVVTQPDRRRGRGKQVVPSPVKQRAIELGCPVFTPERIRRDADCQQQLADLTPDASVVVPLVRFFRLRCCNNPLGMLERPRLTAARLAGAGPIQWSLLEEIRTGVGVMAMEEGLDTGPVLLERNLPIGLLDNAQQVGERLSTLTAELMVEAMPLIEAAGPGPEPERLERLGVRAQGPDHSYARMLNKADYVIDWSASALTIHRQVMGLYPGVQTSWNGKRLKVLATEPLIERLQDQLTPEAAGLVNRWPTGAHKPGMVLAAVQHLGLVVSTAGCPLLIREAQLEGKARSSGQTLVQQLEATEGSQLGQD